MQIIQTCTLEGHSSLQYRIEQHSQRPNINPKPSIALISDYLRRQVSRRATLLLDRLVFIDQATYAKITNLNVAMRIHQHIIKLDVAMQHRSAVTVG